MTSNSLKKRNFDVDFEKFYHDYEEFKIIPYSDFLKLPIEFSFGIYQKFFSDNFIYLNIAHLKEKYFRITILNDDGKPCRNGIVIHSFKEAQEKTIEVAKEYYSKLLIIEDLGDVCSW